ncbi:ankyrin repeat domain-containing protein 50 [Biomphalaria glabrata]|uniref:Uncharacterized protein n=1 Tax=Biomphalaria glabrata TaxID=6526 RepID=A0A2C9M4N3_BIOGL|nr:ankyrin repeat domain-containing protein 50 [Biomphalaria glabrata]
MAVRNGSSPFQEAIIRDPVPTLRLTHKAKNVSKDIKLTLANKFIQAIMSGNQTKIQRFLDRGVQINTKNDYGFGALVAALHIQDEKIRNRIFHFLLDNGASYTARDDQHDRSVLLWGCVLGRNEQVRVLLEEAGGDMNLMDKDKDGNTALHHAVLTGNLPLVELLTLFHNRFGVSVDVEDNLGSTAYLLARRLGYKDIAQHLHRKGMASLGHSDSLFRTPREWSQIGKFERKKAAAFRLEDMMNAARVQGKPTLHPKRRSMQRSCCSLPALNEELHRDLSEISQVQPVQKHDLISNHFSSRKDRHVNTSKLQNRIDSPETTHCIVTKNTAEVDANEIKPKELANIVRPDNKTEMQRHSLLVNNKPPWQAKTAEALSLLEQTSFTKGRVASHFHPSEVDKNKMTEYRHILGSIGVIMNLLSEQNTQSFRKSVKIIRAEPPEIEAKKVSSFAALFGSKKGTQAKRSLLSSRSPSRKNKEFRRDKKK